MSIFRVFLARFSGIWIKYGDLLERKYGIIRREYGERIREKTDQKPTEMNLYLINVFGTLINM